MSGSFETLLVYSNCKIITVGGSPFLLFNIKCHVSLHIFESRSSPSHSWYDHYQFILKYNLLCVTCKLDIWTCMKCIKDSPENGLAYLALFISVHIWIYKMSLVLDVDRNIARFCCTRVHLVSYFNTVILYSKFLIDLFFSTLNV